MRKRNFKFSVSLLVLFAISCNDPRTIVTNIINRDGSVKRIVEMKASEDKFKENNFQIPIDSTWTIRDSVELSEKGDTLWVKRAEKLFSGVDEINSLYKSDSGINRDFNRYASFRKRFKWFNTEYIFSENIDKYMKAGYPVSDFLDSEELRWFYSPYDINDERKNGSDSLKYRTLQDTVDNKVEKWMIKSLSSEWAYEFASLVKEMAHDSIEEGTLREYEVMLNARINESGDDFDSLWSNGIIQKEIMGDSLSARYKTEADSAADIAISKLFPSFSDYTVRTKMPGRLLETNGFADSSEMILWPVNSDYFLTGPYTMMAKSRTINYWAWIISGLFLGFVITVVIVGKKKG